MHEDETIGIFDWNLSVRKLYNDLPDNYPDIQMSEKDFRALLKRALDKYYQDGDEVPAMLLIAGLIRLYQGKT
jgi:hypothetical protein